MQDNGNHVLTVRRSGIATKEVGGEVVVYDLETDKVHLLNPITSTIWRLASTGDGVTVDDAVAAVAAAFADQDDPSDLALAAIGELRSVSLIEVSADAPSISFLDRRRLLKIAGGAAVLGPLVTTILAPPAAASHSPGAPHADGSGTCSPPSSTGNAHCASGTCGADGICGTCRTQHQTCTTSAGGGANRCCTGACTAVSGTSYCCSTSTGTTTTCCSGAVSGANCACTPIGSKPNVPQATLCCAPASNTTLRTGTGTCCTPTGTVPPNNDSALCCSGNMTLGQGNNKCQA